MSARVRTDEPLESAFVGTEATIVVLTADRIYGPFYSEVVAAMWTQDAREAEPEFGGRVMRLTRPFKTVPVKRSRPACDRPECSDRECGMRDCSPSAVSPETKPDA